jgi:hypothetical protein
VEIYATLAYYLDGKMVDTAKDYCYGVESGRECALFFYKPDASNYDNYKIALQVKEVTGTKCQANKISIDSNMSVDNLSVQVTNNSNVNLPIIIIAVVFYDSAGNAISYDYTSAECSAAGSIDYLSFDFPHDENYDTITPNTYKLFINCAHD